jgi:uncharacterized protein
MSEPSKKALFVWGGWEGHEPKGCVDLFAPILERDGFEVTVSDTLDTYLETEFMQSQDLIVQVYTMSTITGEQERISSWSAGSGWRIPEISSSTR